MTVTEAKISIHVPRVEDDTTAITLKPAKIDFNPRPPCGGRPSQGMTNAAAVPISIHVPRVEDDVGNDIPLHGKRISIHVPRVEDDENDYRPKSFISISIHVPRVEDDVLAAVMYWRGL